MNLTNDNGGSFLGGIWDTLQNIEDHSNTALTSYVRRATINSRVYIEKILADEEIMTPLMLNIMNLYTGLVMTAMDMNRYIVGSKRVRDMMSVVATESYFETPPNTTTTTIEDKLSMFFQGKKPQMTIVSSRGDEIGDDEFTQVSNASGSKVLDPEPKSANLPSGRIIEINFGNSRNPNEQANFTVNLYLQLMPYFIPTDVAQQFVEMNFSASLKQRWMQVSAGEIAFFSDFLMAQDKRKRRMKALKHDKTGILREMEERRENNLSSAWMKFMFLQPERQNIANTILIFEKHSFDKICSRTGMKFKNYQSRQKFFNKTMSMILCTVDPMYNKIEMAYNGLDAISMFTFDQVKRNSKNESTDLVKIMENYAKGMAPKF